MGEQPPSTCHSNGFGGGKNGRSDNFSHFSKVFKKYTDQTPQEYRKNFQK